MIQQSYTIVADYVLAKKFDRRLWRRDQSLENSREVTQRCSDK